MFVDCNDGTDTRVLHRIGGSLRASNFTNEAVGDKLLQWSNLKEESLEFSKVNRTELNKFGADRYRQ